jgi:hypothetical protein
MSKGYTYYYGVCVQHAGKFFKVNSYRCLNVFPGQERTISAAGSLIKLR